MATFIYRCKQCDAHVNMVHKIGETKEVICPKCKTQMTIELQPTYFRINGYNSDNGYSGGNNNDI